MIVDSSAVVAILRMEPEADRFSERIEQEVAPKMSVANYFETGMVIDSGRNPILSRQLDRFIEEANIELRPVTIEQARIAREAFRDFGKGSGHPARLNYGDCFAYALAKELGEPLLFKGSDFSATDVESAIK